MTHDDDQAHPHRVDPRAAGLAAYLRERAAAFSLSADITDSNTTARAGLALLDAASIAEAMGPADPRIRALSEAGLFETMPGGTARFVENTAIRAAIQRPVVGQAQDGTAILALLVATGTAPDQPTDNAADPSTRRASASPPHGRLAQLHAELARARTSVAVHRQGRQVTPGNTSAATARLLACLEAYVAELLTHRLPVPPALRDELRLRRELKPPS